MNLKQQLAVRLADSPLWQRWQRLAPRERTSLSLLGAFVLAVLFYLWLWLPAQRQAAEARDYYQAQRELHAYMEQNTELARQMERSNQVELARAAAGRDHRKRAAGQPVHRKLRQRQRRQPAGEPARGLLCPAAALVRHPAGAGVSVTEVSLERAGEGLVNARVSFRAGNG